MAGVEIAGLALGVVGLAGQLLEGSIVCYHFLEKMGTVGSGLGDLKLALEGERLYLERWASYWFIPPNHSPDSTQLPPPGTAAAQGTPGPGSVVWRRGKLLELHEPDSAEFRFAVATLGRMWMAFEEVRRVAGGIESEIERSREKERLALAAREAESMAKEKRRRKRDSLFRFFSSSHSGKDNDKKGGYTMAASGDGQARSEEASLVTHSSEKGISTVDEKTWETVQAPNSDGELLLRLQDQIVSESKRFKTEAKDIQSNASLAQTFWWAYSEKKTLSSLLSKLKNLNEMLNKVFPVPGTEAAGSTPTNLWEGQFEIPTRLPFERNKSFCGRQEVLDRVYSELHPDKSAIVKGKEKTQSDQRGASSIILFGLGGIGKSSIALEYGYRFKDDYSVVLWVDVTSKTTLDRSIRVIVEHLVRTYSKRGRTFVEIAKRLHIDGCIDAESGHLLTGENASRLFSAVKEWLSEEGNSKWLLIIDNLDDPESVNPWGLMSTGENGFKIITTRRTDLSVHGKKVEVEEIEMSAAVSLLLEQSVTTPETEQDPRKVAAELAKKLGNLPLALTQAKSYMTKAQISITKYNTLFDTNFKRIANRGADEWHSDQGSRNRTIFSTWEISFNSLSTPAKEFLTLCAFFDYSDIADFFYEPILRDRKVFPYFKDITDLEDMLEELFVLSLAKRKTSSDSFWIHPVVHAWARARLDSSAHLQKAYEALVLCSHHYKNEKEMKTADWIRGQRIWPHIMKASTEVFTNLDWTALGEKFHGPTLGHVLMCCAKLGRVLNQEGSYGRAITILEAAITSLQPLAKDEHTALFYVMACLGYNLFRQTLYEKAETWLLRALEEARQSTLGNKHQDVLDAVNDVGLVYAMQGNFTAAEEWEMHAYEGRLEALGEKHADTLESVANIADLHESRGDFTHSLEWGHRAIEGFIEVLGEDHPTTLLSMHNIGFCYGRLGNVEKELYWYERALEGRTRSLGKFHPETMVSLMNAAIAMAEAGKFVESARVCGRWVEFAGSLWGTESEWTKEIEGRVRELGRRAVEWGEEEKVREMEVREKIKEKKNEASSSSLQQPEPEKSTELPPPTTTTTVTSFPAAIPESSLPSHPAEDLEPKRNQEEESSSDESTIYEWDPDYENDSDDSWAGSWLAAQFRSEIFELHAELKRARGGVV